MLPATGPCLNVLLLLCLLFRLVAVPASVIAVQPELRCSLCLPQLQLVPDGGPQAGIIWACWLLSPDLQMSTVHVTQPAAGPAAANLALLMCICSLTHLYRQRASSDGLATAGHQQSEGSCSLGGVGAGVAAIAAWLNRHLAADWPCLQLDLDGQRLQQVSFLAPARMQHKGEYLDSRPC